MRVDLQAAPSTYIYIYIYRKLSAVIFGWGGKGGRKRVIAWNTFQVPISRLAADRVPFADSAQLRLALPSFSSFRRYLETNIPEIWSSVRRSEGLRGFTELLGYATEPFWWTWIRHVLMERLNVKLSELFLRSSIDYPCEYWFFLALAWEEWQFHDYNKLVSPSAMRTTVGPTPRTRGWRATRGRREG